MAKIYYKNYKGSLEISFTDKLYECSVIEESSMELALLRLKKDTPWNEFHPELANAYKAAIDRAINRVLDEKFNF